jgi:hypothetical protein
LANLLKKGGFQGFQIVDQSFGVGFGCDHVFREDLRIRQRLEERTRFDFKYLIQEENEILEFFVESQSIII